jgi:hypothetical protein
VEEVDTVIELRPTACQQCRSLLLGDDPDPVHHQVSEIPSVKAEVTEYLSLSRLPFDGCASTATLLGAFKKRISGDFGFNPNMT